ncbi:hypothetical protein ILYODFUR_009523 [Ilyodon furcidens]|uniref:Secreted protein n=1 Tax=Ilyodon furcidens TaxID=33524 RepID=A0ABV0T6K7_9TELE
MLKFKLLMLLGLLSPFFHNQYVSWTTLIIFPQGSPQWITCIQLTQSFASSTVTPTISTSSFTISMNLQRCSSNLTISSQNISKLSEPCFFHLNRVTLAVPCLFLIPCILVTP